MAEDGMKAKDKKFFWLRLKRDFFKRHDIRVIESMPNGKDYILFYLKLLCESVDHEGRLRFSEEIPYNADMLATITNTNVDIVKSAIKVFTQLHMMELLDDGTFFMQEVQKMIGSETYWAERKRIQRAKEEGQLLITDGQMKTADDEIGQIPTESNESPTCPSKSKSNIKSKSYIESNIYNPPYNHPPTEFDEFWSAYPKKVGKKDARKAFDKAIKTVDLDTMLNAISVQKESDQWSRDNGKYIPNPSTWLNQGRWDDELAPKGVVTKTDER